MLVRFMVFGPPLSNFKILFVLIIFGHFRIVPVLLEVNFIREVFLSSFSFVQFFKLTLWSFFFFDICEEHVVVIGPEFLGLFEIKS